VKRGSEPAFIQWRFYLLVSLILLVVAGLLARVIDLTFFEREFLRKQGNERTIRVMNVPAFRGMITDRNGYPLAISTTVYSIWVNPKEFVMNADNIKPLSQKLALAPKTIQALIQKYQKKGREFVYLKRDVIPDVAEKVKALKIPGVYLRSGFKRYYPEGEVTAHVVGSTNIDDKGQEGMELAYNEWLSGTPGKELVVKDRMGRIISELQTMHRQKPGNDLRLSIDHRLQYLAYRELMGGVQKNLAESGSVIIMDVNTGEILAMTNLPSYNPNGYDGHDVESKRNRAVTDLYEPGSTIKAFSIAAALASGLYTPNSIIDTNPGWIRVGGHLLHDEHSKGPMTVTKIMQISSNVGVTKIILSLPNQHLYELLRSVGFGQVTGINFPGERAGVLIQRSTWKPLALATLAFGYGLSVTTLQLADAYAVIANDGVKKPMSLLPVKQAPAGEVVMDRKIAQEMVMLLKAVVAKGGTGEQAQIPGYQVAGKTGTSKKVGSTGGYEKHSYVSSFVGMAPASHPRLVVAVVINNPRGKAYLASDVTAPVFKNIMEGSLRILNIAPDDTESLKDKGSLHDKVF